ncbi:uncharacterized protein LOC122842751 [Gambusia affinis]|uniref:uncharacterized protein LOC122842751 n=1 Tax=Gambusia affinis TaxID=33528 RepID=UPI001CDCF95A|nr:uncharacterized protein LOC122842751 [Gambusia affinis]
MFKPAQRAQNGDRVQFRMSRIGPSSCPTSTVLCHRTLNFHKLPHPGKTPRAQLKMLQNKQIPIRGERVCRSLMEEQPLPPITRRMTEGNPCACAMRDERFCKPAPQEGGITPCNTNWPVSPLSLRLIKWANCTDSEWVLRTINRGYRLQFALPPPQFRGVIQSQASGSAALFLQEEISSLLEKRAIQLIPQEKRQAGFYSRYFLVPKKGGRGMRAILDLRALNRHLRKYKFRMLTHVSLLRFLRPGDWFTSIDLKDAYFHIPIYPPHRKYLRFAFQGKCYEYLVLPFGLSLSPRVFVKCTEAAVAPLRQQGVRVATYIDDWLIAAPSLQEAADHTTLLSKHMLDLGFKINVEKSILFPCQRISFIGLFLDSAQARVKLTEERVKSLVNCMSLFYRGSFVSPRLCRRLLGLMASVLDVVPLGRLHMRGLQRWVASQMVGLQPPQREGLSHLQSSSTSLEKCTLPNSGGSHGNYTEQKSGDDRCLPVRLGGDLRGEISEWDMGHTHNGDFTPR